MVYSCEYPRPAVTADVVPFALREGRLAVLLVRRAHPPFQGAWAAPGGFLNRDERIEEAAWRELAEEAGIRPRSLHGLGPYDQPDRDPRGRVITFAYLGIVGPEAYATAGDDAAETAWHDVRRLPELAFDHDQVLADAVARLRELGRRTVLLFGMLPDRFTMAQARALYAAVYGRRMDARGFSARLLAAQVLVRVGRAGPAYRYRLRKHAGRLLACRDAPLITYR